MQTLTFISIISVLLCLGACAPRPTHPNTNRPRAVEVDVVTIEDQALADVMKTPTEFVLPFHENVPAWERATLFFQKFTQGGQVQRVSSQPDTVSIMSSREERYRYQVTRVAVPNGYKYIVNCREFQQPPNSSSPALRNAKNLSSFIRDGKLEVSLLTK